MAIGDLPNFESDNGSKRPCQLASYEDLFLRLRDAAVILDSEDFRILDCNDFCEEVLGETRESLLGRELTEWVPAETSEEFRKTLRVTRRRYHPREWEVLFSPKAATPLSIRVSACVLKLHDGREAIQVLLRDISKEVEAQKRIQDYIGQLEILNRRLESLSTTDEMTQLANFRHFKNQLQQEHARSNRYNGVYSLIFFDVDHFKHYNDRNGHPAGDQVLREIAQIVKKSCRDTDLPARYGGEEFVVLCPEVAWNNVLVLAQRIQKGIESHSFPFGEFQPLGKVSVSIGLASYPEDGTTAADVLESADQAVYESKRAGRNRITTANSLRSKK